MNQTWYSLTKDDEKALREYFEKAFGVDCEIKINASYQEGDDPNNIVIEVLEPEQTVLHYNPQTKNFS